MYEFAKWLLAGMSIVLLIAWTVDGILTSRVRKKKRIAIATGQCFGIVPAIFSHYPSPEIEFVDSRGEKITFLSEIEVSWHSWPIGSNVKVFYDPNNPADAGIRPTFDIILLGLIVAGGFAVIGGTIAFQWLTK